jgi:threonine dehydrogenase-like Zn-dependent dehydrogenase|tara:strand:- start:313 stop:609 length:297 start_codon:yes stop_codon:yes gene_type:complete
MSKAIIPPQRKLTERGNIIQISVYEVSKSEHYPEGINYSFALIAKNKRVLGYDNNTNEGHHKHCLKDGKLVREKIKFKDWKELFEEFEKNVVEFEKKE